MQQRQLDAAHAVVSEDASVFMFFEQVDFMCLMQNHETKLLFVLALLLFFFLKAKPYDANMSIPPKQVDQQVIVIFVTAYDK